MSKRILFFGNERLATGVTTTAPTLNTLIREGYDVAAVVVSQSDLGKTRKARPLEVAEVANEHGIPVLAPADLLKAKAELAAYGADIGVLIAYGKIVPSEVLDIFPAGIVNIHPSLLPLYRGSTPIESAILNGDTETGVSLMKLSPKMDTGPIYGQSTLALPQASKQSIADTLGNDGTKLLLEQLPKILSDNPPKPRPQDESSATYSPLIQKTDGVIDWQKSAEQLEREIRAYAGWPRSRTRLGSTEVIITKARVSPIESAGTPGTVNTEGNRLVVRCEKGALEIERLIPNGKKEMSGQAFLAGYKSL